LGKILRWTLPERGKKSYIGMQEPNTDRMPENPTPRSPKVPTISGERKGGKGGEGPKVAHDNRRNL